MNPLVCSCGSFDEVSSAFRSLSGDNLALASHPRMGQSHIFEVFELFLKSHGTPAFRKQTDAFLLNTVIYRILKGSKNREIEKHGPLHKGGVQDYSDGRRKRQLFQDRNQPFFWESVNNIHEFSIYSCDDGVNQAELFTDQFRKMQLKLFRKRKQLLSSMSYRWRWCSSTINFFLL